MLSGRDNLHKHVEHRGLGPDVPEAPLPERRHVSKRARPKRELQVALPHPITMLYVYG